MLNFGQQPAEGKRAPHVRLKRWLPHIVVLVWLLFLGVCIWSHVVSSQQPPIYDAISYFQKAKNFWENVDRGQWFNPFNIPPTVRPPGTVLMSYPLGITSDFHGFYFRSVYFPILSVILAVYISIGMSRALAMGWGIAGVALLLSSLPLFYQFEWVDRAESQWCWGMVDSFQAGVAALAAAACVRSLLSRSRPWLCVGAILASFTLLVKPSGAMVMALLAFSWFILALPIWRTAHQNPSRSMESSRYVLHGVLQTTLVYCSFVILCITSKYLSVANFAYARQALEVMKDVLAIPPTEYPELVHRSIGEAVLIWVVAIITLYCLNPPVRTTLDQQGRLPGTVGFLLMAILVWIGGIWYWSVVQRGGDQIRYFFPFASIGFIFLIPMAIEVWGQAKMGQRALILVIYILPAVNIACLLLLRNPPALWQTITGVNVSVGTSRLEEGQARDLLARIRQNGRNANLFVFNSGIPAVAFTSVGNHEAAFQRRYPTLITKGQTNWITGPVTRLADVLAAEYILFRPVRDNAVLQSYHQTRIINTFELENQVFVTWLSGLTEKHGVRLVSETRVRLLEIIDHARFEKAIDQFVTDRSWSAAFNAANPRRYWSAAETLSSIRSPIEKDIRFGGLYILHALTMKLTEAGVKVEVWWEEMKHDESNSRRFMFFHLIDGQGKMFRNQQVGLRYHNIHPDRRWRYDSIMFAAPIDPEVKFLEVGISHPDRQAGILAIDKSSIHWGGQRRLVVPLSAAR